MPDEIHKTFLNKGSEKDKLFEQFVQADGDKDSVETISCNDNRIDIFQTKPYPNRYWFPEGPVHSEGSAQEDFGEVLRAGGGGWLLHA